MAEVPRPRLCHIAKWSHFDGYGFNLHAEKAKPGQFIGKVDEGSPAEKAGLKEGDKIVEVNGVNINQENHKQVVQRIKANPDQTRLLVVDQEAETYHRENGIIIKNTLPYVHHQSSESNNDEVDEVIDTTEQIVINGHGESPEESPQHTPERSPSPEPVETPEPVHNTVTREDSLDLRHSIHSDSIKSNRSSMSSEKSPHSLSSGSPRSTPSPTNQKNFDGLNLNMTAKEMRERIGSRKKRDPRKDERMDFRKKYEIIQTL